MYSYEWDTQTGGLLLNSTILKFSKEPRPVYYQELDILGFDKYWNYEKDDSAPYMWAEANVYYYFGRRVAKIKGGSLYSAPEIEIFEAPEPNDKPLKHVNLPLMIKKNKPILESLTQETIKKAYNAYCKYKNKVDIFHVSFSGGKDSLVCLDIVQKALPHSDFKVLFGDTGMELPDTYKIVDTIEERCQKQGIDFIRAKSNLSPIVSWRNFGPPSTTIRWCCSVHKTAPQLLKLKEVLNKDSFSEMAFVGVRADESLRRSGYDYISYGTKHKGQYSCNPILNWNSAEVYLYIYSNEVPFNDCYKKGNSRAGCVLCPMAGGKNDYMLFQSYPTTAKPFIEMIKQLNDSYKNDADKLYSYLVNGGWNARKNGRDISVSRKDYDEIKKGDLLTIKFVDPFENWKQWINTIGCFEETNKKGHYLIKYEGVRYAFTCTEKNKKSIVELDFSKYTYDATFSKRFKQVFRKSHYCIGCRVCEANCQNGCISFSNGRVNVSEKCIKCMQCHDIDTGCLVYKSLWLPKGAGNMNNKSIDSYAAHGPKLEWFEQFVELGEFFETDNRLGKNQLPNFKCFLKHAGILTNDNKNTELQEMLINNGLQDINTWALMFVNLSYTPQVGWFVKNTEFLRAITQKDLADMVFEYGSSASATKSVPTSINRISQLPFSELGFGYIMDTTKENGYILVRSPWLNPNPLVILYSLYKFAEACGDYYQFTLSRLMNHEIDSDGVTPSQIFGLEKDELEKIIKGLSVNYPDYISSSFNLDLDNINLNSEKTSKDVLELFK